MTCVSGSGDPSGMTQLPETMPAAVFMGLRDVAVEDRPTPRPGPGELLLEVSHCGICGSDLHFLMEWGGRAGVIEGSWGAYEKRRVWTLRTMPMAANSAMVEEPP